MKKLFAILAILLFNTSLLLAQTTTPYFGAIVVSGGSFSDPNDKVLVQRYYYPGQISAIDSIQSNSVTGLACRPNKFVVTTEAEVTLYNGQGQRIISRTNYAGVRAPILLNDTVGVLLFGYGKGAGQSSIKFFSAVSGNILDTIAITREAGFALQTPERLFVSLPGSYPSTEGQIAVINLQTRRLDSVINLGAAMANIGQLYAAGDSVFALASIGYQSTTGGLEFVNARNLGSRVITTPYSVGTGIGILPTPNQDPIFYGNLNLTGSISSLAFRGLLRTPTLVNRTFASGDIDYTFNQILVTSQDYVNRGKLYAYSPQGQVLDSVNVGISPEWVKVIGEGMPTAIKPNLRESNISLYPNPANNRIMVQGNASELLFTNISGTTIKLPVIDNEADVSGLHTGIYLVRQAGNFKPVRISIIK